MNRKPFHNLVVILALGIFLTVASLLNTAPASAATDGLNFTINDTADLPDANPGDGVCAAPNGKCTLRAAIMEANKHKGTDIIQLQANATYLLTRAGNDDTALNGDLDIKESVQIIGNDATIDGNGGVTQDRVIHMVASKRLQFSMFKHFTIRGGNISGDGGGIWNQSYLFMDTVHVAHNDADGQGGGIANNGFLYARDSTVEYNNCGCNSDAHPGGGGVVNHNSLILLTSTVNNNNSHFDGGGIWNDGDTLAVMDSTIANNLADRHGGALYQKQNSANIYHSTIAYNFADANHDDIGYAGGIYNEAGATITLGHTLLGKNGNVEDSQWKWDDCHGALASLGYNLVYSNNLCVISASQNLIGFEPALGTFGANGGPTKTIALKTGSWAIDDGNPNDCEISGSASVADQRHYLRVTDGNGDNNSICDIGALEKDAPQVALACNAAPQPSIYTPDHKSQIKGKQALLGFDTDCAETYQVIVRQGSKKGPIVDSADGLEFGVYLTTVLPKGHTFFARVTACNVNGCGTSKWIRFSTKP